MTKIYGYNVTYSPHDGGYYGEVFVHPSGQEVYVTPILPTSGAVVKNIHDKYVGKGIRLIRVGKGVV